MSRRVVLAASALAFAAALVLAATGESRVSVWLAAGAMLAAAVVWLESGPDSAKEITLVATLGGAAAAGRVLFAADPGRAAGDDRHDRRRRGARTACGCRCRNARRVRVELLPRAGTVDAVPDARLGSVRRTGRAARAAASSACRAGVVGVRARPRVQRLHGRLGVVRVLAARLALVHAGSRARRPVRRRARGRQRRARRSSPGPSCGGCSSATAAACMRRWCGREARRAGRRACRRRPRRISSRGSRRTAASGARAAD